MRSFAVAAVPDTTLEAAGPGGKRFSRSEERFSVYVKSKCLFGSRFLPKDGKIPIVANFLYD